MAKHEVTAPGADFNGASAIPQGSDAQATFSKLLTTVNVAIALERRHESAAHDPARRRAAERSWAAVRAAAAQVCDGPATSDETRAFVAFAMVIARLAATRGTRRGRAFLDELMNDPEQLLALFHHAGCDRARRLMAVAFNQIDRFTGLAVFAPRKLAPVADAA